jgi:Tat protein secretion system quality control protein TatD with DNase activity
MHQIIDTHAHLDEIENLESVIKQAKDAGVVAIIAVGRMRHQMLKRWRLPHYILVLFTPPSATIHGTSKKRR